MAKYYQDFVGLNTFIYETNGWHSASQTGADSWDIYRQNQSHQPFENGIGIENRQWIKNNGPTQASYVSQNTLGMSPMFNTHGGIYCDSGVCHFQQNWWTTTRVLSGKQIINYRNFRFVRSPWNKMDLPKRWSGGGTTVHQTASFFNALMLHRNGPYGFPMWKQLRISDNPITRKQRLHNVFTHVQEPGRKYQITINGKQYDHHDKYGNIGVYIEPVVNDEHKPLELLGGTTFYNPKTNMSDIRSVEVKTSFGNEIAFFENSELNRYYDTIEETDENYEQLKDLYLNDGLDDDSSPIERFNMLIYKQTVFPKSQYAYLNNTRTRGYFVNKFWRQNRGDRTQTEVVTNFDMTVPSQSMWPLDVATDWETRTQPASDAEGKYVYYYYIGGALGSAITGTPARKTGGFNTGQDETVVLGPGHSDIPDGAGALSQSLGGSGILMNSYSQFMRGQYLDGPMATTAPSQPNAWECLTASCFYSRRNTLQNHQAQVSPAGMDITELLTGSGYNFTTGFPTLMPTGSLFEGLAAWDAPKQAGKSPFYDSYDDYARNIRIKGKGYSIIPEFRISSHVKTYESKGVTEELKSIFELSGAMSENTTTSGSSTFYKILSNSDFLKHFDLIKKDHQDFTQPAVITLRCKAIKKFLPYEGFYPAQRTAQMSQQFLSSYGNHIKYDLINGEEVSSVDTNKQWPLQFLLTPLFAPGILFNTIKSGVACDYPMMFQNAGALGSGSYCGSIKQSGFGRINGKYINTSKINRPSSKGQINILMVSSSLATSGSAGWLNRWRSAYSRRIPFEALIDPAPYLSNRKVGSQETHPFSLAQQRLAATWNGGGDNLYTKMANNFLAEVPSFFLKNQNFKTISSLESSNPEFGNAISGNYYTMRVKMYRSRNRPNDTLLMRRRTQSSSSVMRTCAGVYVTPPQDLSTRINVRETLTMYSRPTAFGPPSFGGGYGLGTFGAANLHMYTSGSDSPAGYNFPYTPPYYYGEAWCDLIFKPTETRKYTVSEIVASASNYPYFTRFNWPYEMVPLRDLSGGGDLRATGFYGKYRKYYNSPWRTLIDTSDYTWGKAGLSNRGHAFTWKNIDNIDQRWGVTGSTMAMMASPATASIQHPQWVDLNAMQLDSSLNLFGKAIQRSRNLETDASSRPIEVFSEATTEAKTQWVIQTKFETPILNFNKYSTLGELGLTKPTFASASVPRGMWHQYGDIPTSPEIGVFMQVTDIPRSWFMGQLGVTDDVVQKNVKSLVDLCGFNKTPVKLGECGEVKQISEAVVAVPFIQTEESRKFFSIPRRDVDDTVSALRREVEPGVFVAGGPPKTGPTIIDMVKKMQRYVFPPSMDFVKYATIQPFAMYIFEFTHNLTRQDLADIWQNLPPTIGTSFAEAEAVVNHELLAHELMGGGSPLDGGQVDNNAKPKAIPSDIRWMLFKVKQRAATKYTDKVIKNTGVKPKSALQMAFERKEAKDKEVQPKEESDITYNWPYDFFSLVELVKLDAEVTFSEVEIDEKGTKTFKPKKKMPPALRRERKLKQKAKRKALGKSGALAPGKEDPTLLEKAQDLIGKAKDKLSELNEKRKAKKAARKKKRGERKDKRKDKRADNKSKRKDKKKNKKKNRKDKRKNKKKNKKR